MAAPPSQLDAAGRGHCGVDLTLGDLAPESVGIEIVSKLAIQGFCVVDAGFEEDALEKALLELRDFDALGRWTRMNPIILNGLLGPEGSSLTAELESPDLENELRTDGEALLKLDTTISTLGSRMDPYLPRLGIEITHRTLGLVHQAGRPQEVPAPLTEKQVMNWLGFFIRHRLMLLIFLGPTVGTLELKPYAIQETAPHEVTTWPGCFVILRPDLMSHMHYAPGKAFVLTSFFLVGQVPRRTPVKGWQMTPCARQLDEWAITRLKELKEEAQQDAIWDPDIPRDWQHAMNHMFHKGQMIAVRGTSFRLPYNESAEMLMRSGTAATDFVTTVPQCRWDHDILYDPDLGSWKRRKTYCKHAVFLDGIELFNCRLFNMTPNEAKYMDPHQRLILEVGYEALHSMGLRKNTLINVHCGVYVGCGNSEWSYTNKELDFGAFGATSGALSISSGRFSFVFGLKGPSMTLDTEASSGATAIYMAADSCQKKDRASCNDMANAIAAHLLLTGHWWPSEGSSGWLSPTGRCLTFDSSADGYVRADSVGSVCMKPLSQVIDGELVVNSNEPLIGSIAGAMMNNNGHGASLAAPHGPAEQEAIAEAIRNADISPFDVDMVEVHGSGALLADAIEVGSVTRSHRSEELKDPLVLAGLKGSIGNQREVGGMASFMRALYSAKWGIMTPNLHLRQANPHLEAFAQPCALSTEIVEYKMLSSFSGVMSRGFGGSNVYLLTWGQIDSARMRSAPMADPAEGIQYWPGGGGELEESMRPDHAYSLVGTFSSWNEQHPMVAEGDGTFAVTITLGENRWEQFQIWIDGDPAKVLHPGRSQAAKDFPVYGPHALADTEGCHWFIDGRREVIEIPSPKGGDPTPYALTTPDVGYPGDQYYVRLHIAGKWRTVNWEKQQDEFVDDNFPVGTYYLTGDWNGWSLEEMSADETTQGVFFAEVKAHGYGIEFQVVRNNAWDQCFYPSDDWETGDGSGEVRGPDDQGHGWNWTIKCSPGDTYRIEFTRCVDRENDVRRVVWREITRREDHGHD